MARVGGEHGWDRAAVVLLAIAALVLVGWALRATYLVSMTVVLAAFIAVLVRPVQVWVRRSTGTSWLGTLAAMTTFVAVLALVGVGIYITIEMLAGKAPQYVEQLRGYWDSAVGWLTARGVPVSKDLLRSEGVRNQILSMATGGLMSVWSVLALVVIVFFLLLLMLLEADAWRGKLEKATPAAEEPQVLGIVDTVASKLRSYTLVTTGIGLMSGVTEGLFLWAMGVDLALMWAMVVFVANFIPNIGSIVSLGAATGLALLQFGWQWGLAVGVGLTVIDQTIGNFIAPRVQGKNLAMSSLVILVSLLFWAWVWGIVGALLATPITVAVIVACAHFAPVRWVAVLLSAKGEQETFMSP